MPHPEKAVICTGFHSFELSLVRSLEQNSVPPQKASFSITTGGKTNKTTIPKNIKPTAVNSNPANRSLHLGFIFCFFKFQFSLVQLLSRVWLFATPWLQHTRPPWPSPTPRACSNPCPSNQWCHKTISSSVLPFSSHLQSFPESGSLPMSQLFVSGGQSIGVSASASVLPMNIQDWFPLGWTGWISLHSKGLSRVFSNTTVQNGQVWEGP